VLALDDGEEIAQPCCRARHRSNGSGALKPENRVRAGVERVMFAGLDFELGGDADARERVGRVARAGMLPEAGAISPAAFSADRALHGPESASAPGGVAPASRAPDSSDPDSAAPKFAASCWLRMIPPPAVAQPVPAAGLAWSWAGQRGELVTRFGGAQVSRTPRGFEGSAWLADDARAPHHLLGGLAVMLSHRLGGSVFHAASVELDGGVIAFVGPSGAGKSTACQHVAGAPLVSVDRLALLPLGSRWFSHPLPGGTRPVAGLAEAPPRWRPLAAVLRVQQSSNDTAISAASPALAVKLLRESTFQSGLVPSAEHELLASLEGLLQHVPVARLELRLGASLKPLLRRWLESQAEERR
jgi:hypothetical protein